MLQLSEICADYYTDCPPPQKKKKKKNYNRTFSINNFQTYKSI